MPLGLAVSSFCLERRRVTRSGEVMSDPGVDTGGMYMGWLLDVFRTRAWWARRAGRRPLGPETAGALGVIKGPQGTDPKPAVRWAAWAPCEPQCSTVARD